MQAGHARPKRLFAAAGASSGIADSRSECRGSPGCKRIGSRRIAVDWVGSVRSTTAARHGGLAAHDEHNGRRRA
jgi:hypothetical protein